MTEEPELDAEASFRLSAPLIAQAVDAQRTGDNRSVISALQQLMRIGEASFYGSLAVLAEMATQGVPRGKEPGVSWMPMLVVGNPPRQVNAESDPAGAFVMRFLAASLNGDQDLRLAIWHAFVDRIADGPDSDQQHALEGATALYLLVQLAARGLGKQEQRERRTHQHPHARRRPHHRGQRRR